MSDSVAILGAGSWGMAVSYLLTNNGMSVTMWEFDRAEFEKLSKDRGLESKLPGFRLPESVKVTHSLTEALAGCDLVVLAVPAQSLRSVLNRIDSLPAGVGIVNLAKGLETGTLMRISEIIEDALVSAPAKVVTLSGPSHAEEVIADMPTTVVVGGSSGDFVEQVQRTFSSQSFRVYKCDDLAGVELGGSLKNIIAIAAGILSGLDLGDNSLGALITRGLAEITRLGVTMGARQETFSGLSGIGDLITTCASRHSRNRQVGERLGRGETLKEILSSMTMVAEGVDTTRSGHELASRYNVEMPITAQVYQVLFEGKGPAAAVEELMGRTLKSEVWQ